MKKIVYVSLLFLLVFSMLDLVMLRALFSKRKNHRCLVLTQLRKKCTRYKTLSLGISRQCRALHPMYDDSVLRYELPILKQSPGLTLIFEISAYYRCLAE